MSVNAWGEPMPRRLSGEQGAAWALIMTANEWFDGEDGIAYSVQQRFLRDWAENGPAIVTVIPYTHGATRTVIECATYREAARIAIREEERGTAYVTFGRKIAVAPGR